MLKNVILIIILNEWIYVWNCNLIVHLITTNVFPYHILLKTRKSEWVFVVECNFSSTGYMITTRNYF